MNIFYFHYENRVIEFLKIKMARAPKTIFRSKTKTKRKTLKFRNPFNTHTTQPSSHVFISPLHREGITSLENEERKRVLQYIAQLKNTGIWKKMEENGMIPDNLGVNLSSYIGSDTGMMLPSGITNVETAVKKADAARQIQRFNAGILTKEQGQAKVMKDLIEKQQLKKYKDKVVQYIAESGELDQIPIDFREEVEEYYKQNPSQRAEAERKRQQRRQREDAKIQAMKQGYEYWHPPSEPFSNVGLLGQPTSSTRYDDRILAPEVSNIRIMGLLEPVRGETDAEMKKRLTIDLGKQFMDDNIRLAGRINRALQRGGLSQQDAAIRKYNYLRELERKYRQAYLSLGFKNINSFMSFLKQPGIWDQIKPIGRSTYLAPGDELDIGWHDLPERSERRAEEEDPEIGGLFDEGAGKISLHKHRIGKNNDVVGWRAPRLHKLLRPFKRFEMTDTPEGIIDEEKQALDDRRDLYKDEMKQQRGALPPKEMVERAMPKTAKPIAIPNSRLPPFMIVPHPFVFPLKKYQISTRL